MKLYAEDSSPFSAPVRLAIYAKGLNIVIEPPPGGLLSARFQAINPLGTIPCLMLDGDVPLPESAAILEYFEDRFPQPSLRPEAAEERAHVRVLQRIAELQIMTPLVELWRQRDPAERDPAAAAVWLTRLIRGLSSLQHYMSDTAFAYGAELTLADCELAPALFLLPKVGATFGKPELTLAYPPIARYVARCGQHPAVARVLVEMAHTCGSALTARQAGRRTSDQRTIHDGHNPYRQLRQLYLEPRASRWCARRRSDGSPQRRRDRRRGSASGPGCDSVVTRPLHAA
jgi:glutathione S-transferase